MAIGGGEAGVSGVTGVTVGPVGTLPSQPGPIATRSRKQATKWIRWRYMGIPLRNEPHIGKRHSRGLITGRAQLSTTIGRRLHARLLKSHD